MKYMSVFLALLICSAQIYMGVKDYYSDPQTIENDSVEIICSDSFSYTSIFIAIFKCSLAFLAGGLISDFKFIKFGVI